MLNSNWQGWDLKLGGILSEAQHWATLCSVDVLPRKVSPCQGCHEAQVLCCAPDRFPCLRYSCANLCQIFVLNELFSWDKNIL